MKLGVSWCARQGSNLQPTAPEAVALSIELRAHQNIVAERVWMKRTVKQHPCLEEIPELNSFHRDHRVDVTLISVEIDGTQIALKEFRSRNPIDYPVILNSQQSSDLANLYQIQAIPTTFVINSEGRISARLTGSTTQKTLESKLP